MNSTPLYTMIQSLYWGTYCMMFNYAASFLQDKGFSNSRIGLVLGVCYALSALTQPLFASVIERRRAHLAKGIAAVYGGIALMSLALLFPIGAPLMAVIFTLALTLQNAMQSPVNALSRTFSAAGAKVNFGFARGMGSAVFAAMAMLTGLLLKKMSSAILPAFYFATILALIFFLCRAGAHAEAQTVRKAERDGAFEPLRSAPFVLFLLGIVMIMTAHIFIDNFMLKIMQNIGGGNPQLGMAIAIAAVTELPAMMLYEKLRRRISCPALLGFAGCVWALKHVLIIFAGSPSVIYLCELLQFGSYALYVPAGVEFVGIALPERLYLRGQTFLGAAFSLGCLPATLIGGRLLDTIGIRATLIVFGAVSALGAALFILAGFRLRTGKNEGNPQ